MDSLAYSIFRQKLMSLKAENFQSAVDTIYAIVYEDAYTPVKQKKDKGTDGLLGSTTSLAIYAPEKYKLSDFKKKTTDDFQQYEKNWKGNYPTWNVLTNLDNTGEMITHVKSLYAQADIISVSSTCDLVRNQSWSKIARIFKALGLPENYLSFDIFAMIVDDISSDGQFKDKYDNPIYVKEKVELNIDDEESRSSFLSEYETYLGDFSTIQKVLGSFDTQKVSALRAKVYSTYQIVSGPFLERLSVTTTILSGARSNDDIYCFHIRKLLVYLFEQCLIGKKTQGEINNVTP